MKAWHNTAFLGAFTLVILLVTQAGADNIENHSCVDLSNSSYGTIGDHSNIHFSDLESLTISKVQNHSNVSGKVGTLTIGETEDHVYLCVVGKVQIGKSGDHTRNYNCKSEADINTWRAKVERSEECGN